jgi:hypothetical protein
LRAPKSHLTLVGTAREVAGILGLACIACTALSREDREFFRKFEAIPVGMTEADVLQRLGEPQDQGTRFYLGQPDGFEKQYREAEESASVRYVFWRRDIDVVCAIGLDAQNRVAYKACGGT